MATDVGIKVKVDGEKTFRSAIQAINQQTKELNAEMKAAMAGMSGMASSEEKVAQQTKLLSDYIDKNKEKVQRNHAFCFLGVQSCLCKSKRRGNQV